MYKKTITYEDFDGNERTEDFYFNFSKAELAEMELSVGGGMAKMLHNIIGTKDVPRLIAMFKDMVFKAYGEKSPDGRQFIKSPELSKAFSETAAYSDFFMELASSSQAASEFVNGIIPNIPAND